MRKIFIAALVVVFTANLSAQSVKIEGVKANKFNGVTPIISEVDETVSGYYTYYMLDKGKKGARTFEFAIIDKGVKNVVKTPITLHKSSRINNTVFNGKFFLISYNDFKNKKIVFNVIDLTGKIVKEKSIPTGKMKYTTSTVYPAAGGEGFYVVRPIAEKKVKGFSIEKLDNQLNEKWKIHEKIAKGRSAVADLINTKDRFVIWKEHGLSIKKLKPEIVCYDANTGDKIFSRDGYDGSSTILYNQLRLDKDGSILAGGAYVDGEKYKSANNTGVYLLKLSNKGKEILYTKVSNKEKIQPVLKATSKGLNIGSKDKILVEDLIVDGDNIIVISEMFRKNMNATPAMIQQTRDLVTGKAIGAVGDKDNGKVTLQIMDFMLFKFNQKGDLAEIKAIKKEKYNKITAWNPYSKMYGMDLAKAAQRLGWFDYGYSTVGKDGKRLMVCSNNAEARKPQVFTYALDGSYAKTKINLKQEAKINLQKGKVSSFKTMRNTKGKVAVAYYQRKLKTITINIEPLY